MFDSVTITPNSTSGKASVNCPKARPNSPTPSAADISSHLRSKRSASSAPSNGPKGAAIAMMKVYCRLVVIEIPCAIRSVGTQLEKP